MFSPLILDIIHHKKKRKQVSEKEKRDETSPSKKGGDEVVPTAFRFGLSASRCNVRNLAAAVVVDIKWNLQGERERTTFRL
jgi:hypothetical protein